MRANYHSVETFGTVDGPGIRYVLFLSGCTLACGFCHNRDTWTTGGNTIAVSEVLADYERYRVYYEASGGGITVTGGEPLLQPAFVSELFRACWEKGIHTVLETAGHVKQAALETVLPYTNEVLFGLKAADAVTYRQLTGVSNERIIANLKVIASLVPVTVRYVVIPGHTDSLRQLQELARLITGISPQLPVELLGYHKMGQYKWEEMGHAYPLAEIREAQPADIEIARSRLRLQGIEVL